MLLAASFIILCSIAVFFASSSSTTSSSPSPVVQHGKETSKNSTCKNSVDHNATCPGGAPEEFLSAVNTANATLLLKTEQEQLPFSDAVNVNTTSNQRVHNASTPAIPSSITIAAPSVQPFFSSVTNETADAHIITTATFAASVPVGLGMTNRTNPRQLVEAKSPRRATTGAMAKELVKRWRQPTSRRGKWWRW
ncbi:unnamed protein product [Amoebophrya sp. A120]|nr:unnamed protein product [Amoebophrya sp. A120]|eukprot:GSA120T00020518001.1